MICVVSVCSVALRLSPPIANWCALLVDYGAPKRPTPVVKLRNDANYDAASIRFVDRPKMPLAEKTKAT